MCSLIEIEETTLILTRRFYKRYKNEKRISCNLNVTIEYMKNTFDFYFPDCEKSKKEFFLKEALLLINSEWNKLQKNDC